MATQKADWTILVYIAAHNNLDECGTRSLEQILRAGSSARVNVAVLYDSWQGGAHYIASRPTRPEEKEPHTRLDSGDPNQLLATARWVFERCPAQRYGLVLWSHGSGYWDHAELKRIAQQARGKMANIEEPERHVATKSMALFSTTLRKMMLNKSADERAILFDDGTGHSVDTLELEKVCAAIHGLIGQPLDLLGMDACLMATLEVAYQLRQHVSYLVASEELVPGTSWPYDTILQKLHAMPDMSGADLAVQIVHDYSAYYADNPPSLNKGDVTKIALDLAKIEQLVVPLQRLSTALQNNLSDVYRVLHQSQYNAFLKETFQQRRNPSITKFGYHFWDVATLVASLAINAEQVNIREAAAAMLAALKPGEAVLFEAHQGDWFDGIGGVSIYMAPPNLPVSTAYGDLALDQATGWGAMLKAYQDEHNAR